MLKIFILILVMVIICQKAYSLESISELEWGHRIILVRSTDESGEISKTLNKLDDKIQERDIYWFLFKGEDVKTNYQGVVQEKFYSVMSEKYFNDVETNVILIGKDGGIKHKSGYLDLKELFDLIDTMPMRQSEMRE